MFVSFVLGGIFAETNERVGPDEIEEFIGVEGSEVGSDEIERPVGIELEESVEESVGLVKPKEAEVLGPGEVGVFMALPVDDGEASEFKEVSVGVLEPESEATKRPGIEVESRSLCPILVEIPAELSASPADTGLADADETKTKRARNAQIKFMTEVE